MSSDYDTHEHDAQRTTDTESADQDVILEVRNASVEFEMERGTSRVLDNVSMDIRQNEILGVVGESGSGKSMFASALLDAVVDPGQLSGEVIYHPENGDPVFRALDLGLQGQKILIGLQLRIIFRYQKKTGQGPAHSVGVLDLAFNGLGFPPLASQARDLGEYFPFLVREPFDRVDQIGDQVIPSLQLVFHLRPGGFHGLVPGDRRIVTVLIPAKKHESDNQEYTDNN